MDKPKQLDKFVSSFMGLSTTMQSIGSAMAQLDEYATETFGLSTWWDATERAPVWKQLDDSASDPTEHKFTMQCKAGAQAHSVAMYLSDMAKRDGKEYTVEFNRVLMSATPEQTVEEIGQEWTKKFQELRQQMQAQQGPQ